MPSKGDVEFGALAVKEKLTSKERVDECLKFQEEIEKEGRQTTVDRVMLQKNYLTEAQVFELNKKQGRRVVFCTKCAMKMNVAGLAVGQKIKCPKCGTSNVTPEKIAFELVEKSKPVGEVAQAAPPAGVPFELPAPGAGRTAADGEDGPEGRAGDDARDARRRPEERDGAARAAAGAGSGGRGEDFGCAEGWGEPRGWEGEEVRGAEVWEAIGRRKGKNKRANPQGNDNFKRKTSKRRGSSESLVPSALLEVVPLNLPFP